MPWLPDGEKVLQIPLYVSTEFMNVTDTQTDTRHRPRLGIASRGKKHLGQSFCYTCLLTRNRLRGVYSDTTQLIWTQLNSTDPVEQRTAKSVVFLFMTSRSTSWVNCCSRCRVEHSWVEFSCVAINGPLMKCSSLVVNPVAVAALRPFYIMLTKNIEWKDKSFFRFLNSALSQL